MIKENLIRRTLILTDNGVLPLSEARKIVLENFAERESEILRLFKEETLSLGETKEMLGLVA